MKIPENLVQVFDDWHASNRLPKHARCKNCDFVIWNAASESNAWHCQRLLLQNEREAPTAPELFCQHWTDTWWKELEARV